MKDQQPGSVISTRRSICIVLTSTLVLNAFLLGHLRALADHYAITICISTEDAPVSPKLDPRIEVLTFPIVRAINLHRDLRALVWLIRFLRRRHFDAVHSFTPKGGLLSMLASRLCGVRLRTHTFTGQVWATHRGWSRALLKIMDRLIAVCATDLQADSLSQAQFLEAANICAPGRIRVFGQGSISGVELERFSPEPARRKQVRAALGLRDDATLFIFLGRLHRDKGVLVLAEAFAQLASRNPGVHLALVGPDEHHLAEQVVAMCGTRCHVIGLTQRPEEYLNAADVLCLPSFREGFGTVVIEAAAMGLPTVASRIYGLIDAVEDGLTGLLCPVGDAAALSRAMARMTELSFRTRLGQEARVRAQSNFASERITSYWCEYYREKLD